MKKVFGIVLAGVLALTLIGTQATAAEMKQGGKSVKKAEKKASKGKKYEVVDVACYVKDGGKATGENHKACAKKCLNGGGELALLRGGDLFVPVDKDFKPARNQFKDKGGEMVEVKGHVVSKGGVNYLKVE